MTIENLKVRTNPFKKSPARKKDGLHQIKIRVFVGKLEFGKFRILKTLEIKILDDTHNALMMSSSDFANLDKNKSLQYHILSAELAIKKAVKQLIVDQKELNSKNLFNYVYAKKVKLVTHVNLPMEKEIWNDEVKKWFDQPILESVWEKFLLETKAEQEEVLLEEDISNIADGVLFDDAREKKIKRIEGMDFNERYDGGYYNKDNIFEVFGFCWTKKSKNNKPYVPYSYKSLIFHLNDYRFIAQPSERISDFNDDWIDDFFKFKIKYGYPKIHLKEYDPFDIIKYREKFIKAERVSYKENSFIALVKRFRSYVKNLHKINLLPYSKDTRLIEAVDYLPHGSGEERFTRREHSLTLAEFNRFSETDYKDDRLNLARDMFIIATLGGGFRTQELYESGFYLDDNRLHVYRSKTDETTINPVFGQLADVISRHNGIPKFLKVDDYRAALKEIAGILNFKRKISSPNTSIASEKKTERQVLKDIFNAYFARKTCVRVFNSYDFSEEEIIEFTGHADRSTLKYYKGNMTIEDKERLIKSKIKESNDD